MAILPTILLNIPLHLIRTQALKTGPSKILPFTFRKGSYHQANAYPFSDLLMHHTNSVTCPTHFSNRISSITYLETPNTAWQNYPMMHPP